MKIAVVGLGAIGGLIAARLAHAGREVSALARGATLAAVRNAGLRVELASGTIQARLDVSDDAAELGPQDLVIVALKAPALIDAAPRLAPLLGPGTVILPAMNGVPWWFMQTATSPAVRARFAEPLASVDPSGAIARALPLAQVLGGVVHLTCASTAPGVIRHGLGNRIIVGEPAGGASPRLARVQALLSAAGFDTEQSADIRSAIWYKLWGNMTTNPISALTAATTDQILDDPLVQRFMLAAMGEAAAVGAEIGCPISESGAARVAVTRQLGAFRTSMLQDAAAGRPLEIDALIGAVHEIAARLAIATPNIDALFGLARLMARQRGLYPRAIATSRPN